MNTVFFLGLFLIPFENFFFAPSDGWAAITPIVWAVYLLMNPQAAYRSMLRYNKLWLLIIWGVLLFLLTAASSDASETTLFSRFIGAMTTVGLGLISLYSFDIYLLQRNGSIQKVEKILIWAYAIALLIGVIEYIAITFNISYIYSISEFLFKRNNLVKGRVQFFFTEPSFIGMHLYGVLLPLYIYTKNSRIRSLLVIFALLALAVSGSVRIVLDTVIVIGIIIIYRTDWNKVKNIVKAVVFTVVMGFIGVYAYNTSYRIRMIFAEGIYADGSLASRWFRVNASFIGYGKDLSRAVWGYGIGNEGIPLDIGHNKAELDYTSVYIAEVDETRKASMSDRDSVSYCMYTRLISEFGILVFCFMLFIGRRYFLRLRGKDWKMMFVIMLYLYLQFESYGFYTFWLFFILYRRFEKDVIGRNNHTVLPADKN